MPRSCSTDRTMDNAPALDHVGLSVGDLESMTDWYCRILDLQPVGAFSLPALDLRGVFVTGAGGIRFELLKRAGSTPGPRPVDQPTALLTHGLGHIRLRVPDVDQAHLRLIEGGPPSGWRPGWPRRPGFECRSCPTQKEISSNSSTGKDRCSDH
jgi:hypothetical protein